MELFASDTAGTRGSGDAQRILGKTSGSVDPFSPLPVNVHFTFKAAGNHRGEWITATLTRLADYCGDCFQYVMRTSELSAPVQVSP